MHDLILPRKHRTKKCYEGPVGGGTTSKSMPSAPEGGVRPQRSVPLSASPTCSECTFSEILTRNPSKYSPLCCSSAKMPIRRSRYLADCVRTNDEHPLQSLSKKCRRTRSFKRWWHKPSLAPHAKRGASKSSTTKTCSNSLRIS